MAVRDIVTRGFGNGTYDPGVSKVPTRGYGAASITITLGPYCVEAGEVFIAGAVKKEIFVAGIEAGQGVCN
jgi:hypothetical protein